MITYIAVAVICVIVGQGSDAPVNYIMGVVLALSLFRLATVIRRRYVYHAHALGRVTRQMAGLSPATLDALAEWLEDHPCDSVSDAAEILRGNAWAIYQIQGELAEHLPDCC